MRISKKAFSLIAVAILIVGVTCGAVASGVAQQITATLDPSVSVLMNGQNQIMTDATGTQVYPIMYNGSTYLPVRAVSTIFGIEVDWDNDSRSVLLGGSEKTPVNLTTNMGTGNNRAWKITDPTELVVATETGNVTFQSGIHRVIWNSSKSTQTSNLITHNVTGYTTVTFTAWSDIDATIVIYDKDLGVISSTDVNAGALVTKEIDITGYSEIGFGANAQKAGTNGIAKIFDPIVK